MIRRVNTLLAHYVAKQAAHIQQSIPHGKAASRVAAIVTVTRATSVARICSCVIKALRESIGGAMALFLLAMRSGFRLDSSYWRWRGETAFGSDPRTRPPIRLRLSAMMDYGRWVYRMKRRL